ncbi:hypothetical protein ABZV31_05840 [Streptomyces sp. NPDC005202]|uniref:hypothetical protein n=1 Tax=Streptomyces sp. NPDC005202 TaxID=3157021 RepID=UPI0033A72949
MGNGESRVRGLAARAGGLSARHRWAAVGIWVLFVVLAMGLGSAAGGVDVKDSDRLKRSMSALPNWSTACGTAGTWLPGPVRAPRRLRTRWEYVQPRP